jgi:hypothetical protein
VQEFITAVDKASEPENAPTRFKIDGREVAAFQPADGQLALLMASMGRGMQANDAIAATVNFFCELFEGADKHYVEERLLNREHTLPIEKIQEILEWLIEQWSARPTQSPSDSPTLPASVGQNSTATTPAPIF